MEATTKQFKKLIIRQKVPVCAYNCYIAFFILINFSVEITFFYPFVISCLHVFRIPIDFFTNFSDLFDYANLDSVKVNTAIVMMSRGCFYNCTYCGNSQFRNVYPNKKYYARFRSPENGILYLKTLLSKYPNIQFINFRDAIFNMFPDWFDKFIELYKQEIHFYAFQPNHDS